MTTSAFLSPLYDPGNTYTDAIPGLGRFHLRAIHCDSDSVLIHDWVSRDYARFWGMRGDSREQVATFYRGLHESPHSQGYLGFFEGRPAFLVECYQPQHDPIGAHYDVRPGDRGMHVLVAPPETRIPRFTWGVLSSVMTLMFSDPATKRVVVEPDVRNERIHPLNRRVGFRYDRQVHLPEKTAHLAFCTRAQFHAAYYQALAALSRERLPAREPLPSREQETTAMETPPAIDTRLAHLDPERWARANRQLIRKAIAEFAHERLVAPRRLDRQGDWGDYTLPIPGANGHYRFRARRMQLDHWWIAPGSLAKIVDDEPAELDAQRFIIEFSAVLGLDDETLPVYLEEIGSTLSGSAYKQAHQRLTAPELAHGDFQAIESAMTEGHPSFVANNGRIGFDADDYHAYAPEAGADIHLVWLAVHTQCAEFSSLSDLPYTELLEQELGHDTVARFHRHLQAWGLDPGAYLLMPLHPWQWHNKLATSFASEIANRRIVYLGTGDDRYRAQQSIRTMFNTSQPQRRYVKTALSILNMGFMRGLSPYYMQATPAINEWLKTLLDGDAFLADNGFTLLREEAAIGYRNAYFEDAVARDSPHKKMLACLWRESPLNHLPPGQRLMTMAALLHRDKDGQALLPALVEASGLAPRDWLRRYLTAYLTPILHCFYAHDLVFMPHGENVILQLDAHVPVRAIMKDIAEESAIMDPDAALPEGVKRLAVAVPEHLKVLSLFTDTFDCFFRYLAPVMVEHGEARGDFTESDFWHGVAECILDYQRRHPEFADKFARHDLFAPTFARSCLNRLQLGNNRQMIDLADPSKNLQLVGELDNPIAPWRPSAHDTDDARRHTETA
ncbi:GNAT family N-acetyltransferase [Chromohalobacter sp. TMW 2.2308]|uniref:GNAT family N-acetyltransferase n=1 Tax=Chromohalobacter moromii TaxID=2860329 RepID=A0A9X2X0V0_9GAMM|nr:MULTISPECIES: GNAT family N-acetyltransferase [Chromohalobacter]MCK2041600.1 GNAT family N-acetyltransferase [Chromohalobacter moromii]MCK2044537.1 GNAT family N-acetyltransferase [Chromohalobacter moromii]MCT8504309.1 GNAT family N-acetyltransferase [Chromohalobacter moromii]MCT8513748.1 GNAT family N-acetyltransferase [Chromohalobacter sp. TMW 2.2271]